MQRDFLCYILVIHLEFFKCYAQRVLKGGEWNDYQEDR